MKTQIEINQIVELLIKGNTVFIKDKETRKEVQKAIREIKNNCTIVLSQLKNNN
jgi:hypothetical protein